MATRGELIILGCGGSAGTPAIGNWWGACDPSEPRNRRTRPSVALKTDEALVIVDPGPDLREQMNREGFGCPDAIIVSHTHFDHINGLDEFRTLQRRYQRKFPIHASHETLQTLQSRFDYMFIETENGFYAAVLEAAPVTFGDRLVIGDIGVHTYAMAHGSLTALGIRVGDVGYSTDFKSLDGVAIDALRGVEVWIADAAAYHSRENHVHACIEEVIELNRSIGAREVYLTHLPPTMDYKTLLEELPAGFKPAYDGLRIPFRL